jgi:hypothetical protein
MGIEPSNHNFYNFIQAASDRPKWWYARVVRSGPPAPGFSFSSPRSFEINLQAVSLSQTTFKSFKSFVAQSLPKASLYPPSKLNIQNPVLSPVAQRSPKLGNSNTGLSSANTASLEIQAIAALQGTSRTDDCSSGRVLPCDVQTHQCPSSPANVSAASRLRQPSLGRSSPLR